MSDYDNRNRFVLFKNKNKGDDDKKPEYTGSFTDGEGNEYFCDAWIQTSGKGEKFMSGRVKLKQQRQESRPKQAVRSLPDDDGPPF